MHRVHVIQHIHSSSGYGYWLLVRLFLEQSLVSSPPQRYFQMQFSINHRRIFRVDPAFSVQQHQSEQVNPFCRRPTSFDGAQALYLLSTGYKPLYAGSMFLNELVARNKGILVLDACTAYFQKQAPSSPCSGFSCVIDGSHPGFRKRTTISAV